MTPHWDHLILAIRKMPGVGPKMAERMALHLLRSEDGAALVKAILEAKAHLTPCSFCGLFTDLDPCRLCRGVGPEQKSLCVIEDVGDLIALRRAGTFHGYFHLLGGVLSPLDGIGPKQLRIDPLIERLKKPAPKFEEVILATNPTVEGEATATYLAQLIEPLGLRTTRLAYGLPAGSSLEYADELTLTRAFEGRKEFR